MKNPNINYGEREKMGSRSFGVTVTTDNETVLTV